MTDLKDKIRDIRIRLRLSMNGVVSASMREKGADYKLNFGVSLPKIKEIAGLYEKNVELAETIWHEDVRELKILATLLFPPSAFTVEDANRWIGQVRHQEIAEQLCRNLLQELPFAEALAGQWVCREEEYVRVAGFLLFARLCVKGAPVAASAILKQARQALDNGISRPQRAAIVALKRYGCQGRRQADEVLTLIADYPLSESPERQEFFNDIKFEFDYYL